VKFPFENQLKNWGSAIQSPQLLPTDHRTWEGCHLEKPTLSKIAIERERAREREGGCRRAITRRANHICSVEQRRSFWGNQLLREGPILGEVEKKKVERGTDVLQNGKAKSKYQREDRKTNITKFHSDSRFHAMNFYLTLTGNHVWKNTN
jgi:hypothetical protein